LFKNLFLNENVNVVNENAVQSYLSSNILELAKNKISPKILNFLNQLKSIFIGLSQGYTINLELNGIGFYGTITTLDTMSHYFSNQKNFGSSSKSIISSSGIKNRKIKLNTNAILYDIKQNFGKLDNLLKKKKK